MSDTTVGIGIEASLRNALPAFRQLMRVVQQVEGTVARANSEMSRSSQQAGRALMGVTRAMAQVGTVGARSFGNAHTAARSAFSGIGAAANAALGPLRTLATVLATGGAIFGGGGLVAGLKSLADTGVDMNLTLGGATQTLTRMTGSAAVAGRLLADLRQEALYSASTFKDLLAPTQSLAAVFLSNLGPRGLGQVIPTLRAFGDAAVSLRVDTAGVQQALYGFRQLLGRPLVQMEEVNQVDEALPGANIRGILKRVFGSADTEVLQKAGVTGVQAGMAIIKGLQKAFGGAQRALGGSLPLLLSSIQDSINDLSGPVTQGLTRRLTEAARRVADFVANLDKTAGGRKILEGLMQGFNAIGDAVIYATRALGPFLQSLGPFVTQAMKATGAVAMLAARVLGSRQIVEALLTPLRLGAQLLEYLSKQARGAVRALEEIVNVRNVARIIVNSLALLKTVAETVLSAVGLNFGTLGEKIAAALDPAVVRAAMEAAFRFVSRMVEGGIRVFFGLGRVWQEIGRIIKSTTQDIGDWARDTWSDMSMGFVKALAWMGGAFAGFAAGVLMNISDVAAGFNAMMKNIDPFGLVGKALGINARIDTDAINALATKASAASSVGAAFALAQDTIVRPAVLDARKQRDLDRLMEDPYRKQGIGVRLSQAFQGHGRDSSAEIDFFERLRRNEAEMRAALFPRELVPTPTAPPAAMPSVTSFRPVAAPALPTGADFFSPVTLPDGRVISQGSAAAMQAVQLQQAQRNLALGAGLPSSPAGGGTTVYNLPINVNGRVDVDDPQVRRKIHEQVDQRLDQLRARAYQGPYGN